MVAAPHFNLLMDLKPRIFLPRRQRLIVLWALAGLYFRRIAHDPRKDGSESSLSAVVPQILRRYVFEGVSRGFRVQNDDAENPPRCVLEEEALQTLLPSQHEQQMEEEKVMRMTRYVSRYVCSRYCMFTTCFTISRYVSRYVCSLVRTQTGIGHPTE